MAIQSSDDDLQTTNEDWIKTLSWDLPTNLTGLLWAIGAAGLDPNGQADKLEHLMTLPAWRAAPAALQSQVEAAVKATPAKRAQLGRNVRSACDAIHGSAILAHLKNSEEVTVPLAALQCAVDALNLDELTSSILVISSTDTTATLKLDTEAEQRAVEMRWKGGYPQALVDWYEAGADGAIDWGSPGDFEDCVAIASKYIDNPEGFCNLRHQGATGAPPGKAAGESEDKSASDDVETRDWAEWDAEHEQGHEHDDTTPHEHWMVSARVPNAFGRGTTKVEQGPMHSLAAASKYIQDKGWSKASVKYFPAGTMSHRSHSCASVLGARVRRWHPTTRDWAEWDAEHEGSWSAKAITEDEARGNSRPVSAQEYEQLANTGQQRLAEIEANTRPMSAFNDDTKWSAIKESAYSECQKPWGGQTIDPQSGQVIHPSTGYALTIRPAGATQISVPENATADELAAAMDQAKEKYSDQLQGAATYLGVFHDDDEHRIDVDPVVHVADTKDVETIGAYTHASGGAYDFATGDGYFPPHVGGMKQLSDQYVKTGKPTTSDVDTMIHNYQVMHGTMPSDSAIAKLHKKAGM